MLHIYVLLMTLVSIQGNDLCVPKLYKNILFFWGTKFSNKATGWSNVFKPLNIY